MGSDARARYTRMRVKEAFFDCLKKKPVNKITVTELCEKAEINRSTFYTHYTDPFDLLAQLENEALDEMREFLKEERNFEHDVLPTILHGVETADSTTALLVSENGDPAFAQKISELFYESYIETIRHALPDADEETQSEVYHFLASGCGSMLSHWLSRERRISPEELTERIRRLSGALLRAYREI